MAVANLRPDSRRKSRSGIVAFFTCLLFLYFFQKSTLSTRISSQHNIVPYCPQNPLSEDVLVVVRTGATEVLEKLPVHLSTTLRCIPNYVIYSDLEEEIEGHHIHDVFDGVSQDLLHSVPDFELYRQLKTRGRESLSTNRASHDGSGPMGQLNNPGWKLDKFKFLPMLDKALRHRPHTKWFVFIELDTYLIYPNLLAYLSTLDATQPLYIGKHMAIATTLFAHGGSGFALSAPAVRKATHHWRAHTSHYDAFTTQQWAGDMVLGKLLSDVGIKLTWAFPHFQGDPVAALDHNVSKVERRPWCHPALTYHHMRADEIRALWAFEQEWWRARPGGVLRHADVFRGYVLPSLRRKRVGWDNFSVDPAFSGDVVGDREVWSFDECRETCMEAEGCLQFSYRGGRCLVSREVRMGRRATEQCVEYSPAASKCVKVGSVTIEADEGIVGAVGSGWVVERLAGYASSMDQTCSDSTSWLM